MKRLALALAVLGQAALAAPETSARPVMALRMVATAPVPAPQTSAPVIQVQGRDAEPGANGRADRQGGGIGFSLRPFLRSSKAEKAARERQKLLARGAVCGDVALQGERIGAISGAISGCGIADAVRLRSVAGVTLSETAVMDCRTAKSLKDWLVSTAKPALANSGGGLAALGVAAHYSCRTRNNQPGAKISEHGKGRAIDISAFHLADGRTISVLNGWDAGGTRNAMRLLHRGACGPFGTVLGPDADRYHLDHFHFDTARHRNGSYCR